MERELLCPLPVFEGRLYNCSSSCVVGSVVYSTFLHRTHQYELQGLDLLEWITLRLDVCIHVTTHIINKGIVLTIKWV